MADFVNIRFDETQPSSRRAPVTMILIGKPEAVAVTIASLQVKGFTDARSWSKPLQAPESRAIITRAVGEVMRVYKHYVTL